MSSPFSRVLWVCCAAASMLLLGARTASAQVTVTDDGFSFSPDPVNITVGGSVIWVDDGSGPYVISSDTGAWPSFSTPGGVIFPQVGSYSYHDDAGDFGTVIVSPNFPPSITITNPASNAVFSATANFLFAADASDPDPDGMSDVEFYVGTNLVDDVFMSPYTTMVTNLAAGTYMLTAIAYDNLGATATNQITIYVGDLPLSLSQPRSVNGTIQFDASGLTVGKTNVLQTTTNVATRWVSLSTNVAGASSFTFTNAAVGSGQFFRLLQLP